MASLSGALGPPPPKQKRKCSNQYPSCPDVDMVLIRREKIIVTNLGLTLIIPPWSAKACVYFSESAVFVFLKPKGSP